ncbi:MAG: SH3 domain-containing protein [Actinobacteria bacterium]|nr:MAG: SH3 domain-containing protein [Actinomycetota bacterium]
MQKPLAHDKAKKNILPWVILIVILLVLFVLTANGLDAPRIKKQDVSQIVNKPLKNEKVEEIDSEDKEKVKVIIQGLRLRSTPSVAQNIITSLAAGTQLLVLEEKSGWLKVKTQQGQEGYVSSNPNHIQRLK